MRSEDNLTSPSPEGSRQDVRGGASPFQQLPEGSRQDVRSEEWGSAGHRAGPGAARWEGRCSMLSERTIVAQQDVQHNKMCMTLFGHRLSHHWDILRHVDGSATVRENGCLSTATPSTGNGSLAATLPSRRGRGATCAKVWNAIRRDRSDCILCGKKKSAQSSCKIQHWDSATNTWLALSPS